MSHLQVQGLWESFSGILNSSDISNPTLSKFLKNAPIYLEKIPQAFLSQEEDSAETLLKKKRFIIWLIHRLLLLKFETLSQKNFASKFHIIKKFEILQEHTDLLIETNHLYVQVAAMTCIHTN